MSAVTLPIRFWRALPYVLYLRFSSFVSDTTSIVRFVAGTCSSCSASQHLGQIGASVVSAIGEIMAYYGAPPARHVPGLIV